MSSAVTQINNKSDNSDYIQILNGVIKNNEKIIQEEEAEKASGFTKVLKGFTDSFNSVKSWGYRESLENCQPFNVNIQDFLTVDFFIPKSACSHIQVRHPNDYKLIKEKFDGDTIEEKFENLLKATVNSDANNSYTLTETYQNPNGVTIYVPCVKFKTNISVDNQEKAVVLVFSKLKDSVKRLDNSKKGFVLRTAYFEKDKNKHDYDK